ncbi:uncharacterized protein LOC130053242 [Ostrea edulis]|uniref:uncharacterized protein LOC130053242 n=1 Tax=Ostrea edulis TaxID=37623 RepID=UPI0024AFB5F8|nr:uncharacterized protein LOC130053242 [Ostrea edulis]
MDEYSQLLLSEDSESEGSLDLDATQTPTQPPTTSSTSTSPSTLSPGPSTVPVGKPRKRQINHFLAIENPSTSDFDPDVESSQSLLKRRKTTTKGKSTQTLFTGSFATNTCCIIYDEKTLVEIVNVNEKKIQTHVFGTVLGLSSNIYYKF